MGDPNELVKLNPSAPCPRALLEELRPARCTPRTGARGEARKRAMLDAAAALFREKGFERTTLSDVIARSGGSRATLYEAWEDKEGLLVAVLEDGAARFWSSMDVLDVEGMAPRDALTALALRIMGILTEPGGAEMYRLLVSEGYRYPKVISTFMDHGPCRGQARLAAYLAGADRAGLLRIPDAERAAETFFAMIHGNLFMERLMFPDRAMPRDRVEASVTAAVEIFLGGVAGRP